MYIKINIVACNRSGWYPHLMIIKVIGIRVLSKKIKNLISLFIVNLAIRKTALILVIDIKNDEKLINAPPIHIIILIHRVITHRVILSSSCMILCDNVLDRIGIYLTLDSIGISVANPIIPVLEHPHMVLRV